MASPRSVQERSARAPGTARAAVALVLAALLVAPPAGAQEISNPDLFDKSLQAARQAADFYGLLEDPAEERRLADIGYRVARESGYRDFPFSFYLIDMPVPNAFALPGGHIFLTRGMLELGLDDDMLAGLLGHEIGHVVRQHGMRMQKRATLLNILSTAVLAGVVIAAGSSDRQRTPSPYPYPYPGEGSSAGDRITGAAAAGVVVSELLLRSYSREFEDEADDEGQRMAAAAGFDPAGTRKLMALMRERLPETKEYGYWRTHPFFDQRVQAAEVRSELLKIQPPEPADEYRRKTQEVLLAWREKHPQEPLDRPVERPPAGRPAARAEKGEPRVEHDLVKLAALAAWPIGAAAETLRLEKLQARRDRVLARNELSRDYGALIDRHRTIAAEVAELDPGSDLPRRLAAEVETFESARRALYPKAVEVFRAGVYEVEFLETFASNYPDAPERPEVALALGQAYSRLGRTAEGAKQFLLAARQAPESEAGRAALRGLRNLTPMLDRLAALQELADDAEDAELRSVAAERLAVMATTYKDLDNGAAFLKQHPGSPWAEKVTERLHSLAENLYGEVVLYQTVGDHVKALDRIQRILTHAPLSPAAERLRASAVLES